MTKPGEEPLVARGVVDRRDAQDTIATPPEDQRFFDEALEVSLRGMRHRMEMRRKRR
jgi:hypothetical protein